jgi:hypothetical protein
MRGHLLSTSVQLQFLSSNLRPQHYPQFGTQNLSLRAQLRQIHAEFWITQVLLFDASAPDSDATARIREIFSYEK